MKYSLLKKWFIEAKSLAIKDMEEQIDNYFANISLINIYQDIAALHEQIWADILRRELIRRK